MQFTLVTMGSEGDIRVFLALAAELKAAGHQASIATSDFYTRMIKSYGIPFLRIGNFTVPNRRHFTNIRFFRTLQSTLINCPGFLEDLWEVCKGADVIIYNVTTFPCFYIAEKLQIPCFAVFGQPHHPTRAFPDPSVTHGRPIGGLFNLLGYHLFDLAHWLYIRRSINRWRRIRLQFPPIPAHDTVIKQIEHRKLRVLYSYSPVITPKPKEWRIEGIQVTGYWFLNAKNSDDLPPEISNFLKDGDPPVFISAMWNTHLFTKASLIQMQELLGRRLVVQDLYSEMRDMASSDRILYIRGPVSHQGLFKGISIAVHHGGLGICMNCIRAGIPMIMLPSDESGNDHRFWAEQVISAGAGVRCYFRKNRFIEALVFELKKALENAGMKQRTVALSKKISSENGARNAAEFILEELSVNASPSVHSRLLL